MREKRARRRANATCKQRTHEMRRTQLASACAAVGQPEKGYLAVHRRWRTRLAREGRYLKSGEYVKNR